MATAALAATVTVHMGARAHQPARNAIVQLRWQQLTLHPPTRRAAEHLAPITVWAVWAIEGDPPTGLDAVEWLLLTTVPIRNTADALERLAWYAARSGKEVWHKVLKSGCQIEERQLERADRLMGCLALYSVIAWRML
jgi:hypothetical protein